MIILLYSEQRYTIGYRHAAQVPVDDVFAKHVFFFFLNDRYTSIIPLQPFSNELNLRFYGIRYGFFRPVFSLYTERNNIIIMVIKKTYRYVSQHNDNIM